MSNAKKQNSQVKAPISHKTIYKIMLTITLTVGTAFFIKNVISKELIAAIAIGICLAAFSIMLIVTNTQKTSSHRKEFVLSISLLFLVFMISLFSGASYSDDFPMFLAVMAMTGMYLEPSYTKIQIVLADVLLVLMYIIHPEKAGPLSQYILCIVVETLAAYLMFLTIKRGRAFIDVSNEKAAEAEKLLDSIRQMGTELEKDFRYSAQSIDNSTKGLKVGSETISSSANKMSASCYDIHDKIQTTSAHITELNKGVKNVEVLLNENNSNISELNTSITTVDEVITQTNAVFDEIVKKMRSITQITTALNDISFNTTILSINASIEAAKAGSSGAGFDVVATRMRELSESSNAFSEQVSEIIEELEKQIAKTGKQFKESITAIEQSGSIMNGLQESFTSLTQQFDSLYNNIEEQNTNISTIDDIFEMFNQRVADMTTHTSNNSHSVDDIIQAMDIYKENITKVINQTKEV